VSTTPLRKRRPTGELYTRTAETRAKLSELLALSRDELISRCGIRRRDDPLYVPSECILYFVRVSRADNSSRHFERLYTTLLERVLRRLPRAESPDGKTRSLTKERIREKVSSRLAELLASDRQTYCEKLDYFEVRFDGALANLRRDAQEQAWREERRSESIELDGETGELSPEVECAAGSFNPFDPAVLDDIRYRSRLDAAIDTLPPEQSRIIEMLRLGIPIDSQNPEAITIARVLNRAEKTIRLQRDKAFAALRVELTRRVER